MPNRKIAAVAAVLGLALTGCGGDDDEGADSATRTVSGAGSTTPPGPDTAKPRSRPNNNPVVQGDLGTKSVGKLTVRELDYALDRSEQALLVEGVWSVTAVNEGGKTHALAIDGPNGETESGPIAPGSSKTVKVYMVTGDYELYCPLEDHADRGMRTTLPVGPSRE